MKNFSGASILVTGGNGAIGSNLVRKLLNMNSKVVVLDDFSQSKTGNLPSNRNLCVIKGDITNKKILSKVFSHQFDYVFHLAARFANELSIKDPLEDLRVNVQGTLQILMHASKQKPERLLYTSSSSIYGPQESTKLKESLILHPSTPYAASKLTAEHYCRTFHELHGIDCTIVRLSNSYGAFDPPGKYRNVIPNFMHAAVRGKNLIITGTGNETRDFTYVDDCVNGIILAATQKRGKNETFNLGTGKETPVRKIADMILKITKSRSKIVFKPMRSFDHIKRRKMDISKAQKMLHYNPTTDIETGLAKTYQWFLNR
ncbi:MAG TPA: NAD-dependent epimerase/dehydratase family protein [Nitrosopumilaceae archaeon]|nr:NAD-dependent epimerase/dehydratase family protein [Nitrosopumilaceae archaeon]